MERKNGLKVLGGQDCYGRRGTSTLPGRERTCLRVSSVNVNGLNMIGEKK